MIKQWRVTQRNNPFQLDFNCDMYTFFFLLSNDCKRVFGFF